MAAPKPNPSMHGEPDYQFKICVIGAAASGKTAMVEQLISKQFNAETKTTVGVEYRPYRFDIDQFVVQLALWDTAGQETYKAVAKSYFRDAVGCVLVFDLTNSKSFDELQFWFDEFQKLADSNAFILLVGNKSDLEDQRQIQSDAAQKFADDHHISYIETSALNGQNIPETFQRLARGIFDMVRSGKINVDKTGHATKGKNAQNKLNLEADFEDDETAALRRSMSCC